MELIKTYPEGTLTTEQQIVDILVNLSKKNPDKYYAAEGRFMVIYIYEASRKSQIKPDTNVSRQMMSINNCIAYRNGKKVQPSPSWLQRHNRIPFRD